MPIIIFIFIMIILVLIELLVSTLISLIIPLAVASLPAYGAGLAVGFGLIFAIRQHRLNSLDSPNTFARVVTIGFDGKKLNCSINHSEFMNYAASQTAIKLSVLACIGTTTAILIFLAMATQVFLGHALKFWGPRGDVEILARPLQEDSLIISIVICILIITYTFKEAKLSERFNRSIREEIDRRVSSANLSLKTTDELESVIKEIAALSTRIKVQIPQNSINSMASIHSYIESHKAELLISTAGLTRKIDEELARANDDWNKLESAVNLHENAMSIYTDTSRQVNRTSSMPLIKELEYDYAGLTHSDLKSLLPQKRWPEFHTVVNSIIEDLQRLKDLAVKYELHEEEYEEFEEESSGLETNVEKAYRILSIPPTSTDEQIKRVCNNLRKAYHPDQVREEERKFFDDKLKEINWTYDILKSARSRS